MVGIKRIKLYLCIFIPFCVFFLMSHNTFAADFNSWLNIQDISKTNLSNDWITHNTNNAGSYSVAGSSTLQTYRLSASANLPSQASGAYFSAKGDIFIDIPSSLEGGLICDLINDAFIVPEYVSYNTTNSVLSSCSVSNPNIYMRRYTLHIETSGSIPSQANFTSFYWSIGNTSNQSIISLVGTPNDSPRVFLSGNINISISNSPELEGLGIINQNITIISNDLKDMQQQMSENTDAIINNQNENTEAIIKSNQNCHDSVNLMPLQSMDFNDERVYYFNINLPAATYTLSYDLDSFSLGSNNSFSIAVTIKGSDNQDVGVFYLPINSFTTLGRKSHTFTLTGAASNLYNSNIRLQISEYGNGARAKLSNIQIEEGSTSSPYEPFGEEICKNINEQYYDEQRQADENISNQSPSDIDGAENQATTNLIGVLSGFISAFSNINATNCNLTLEFPNYAGGTRVVNICSGKEKAPRIVEIGSSLLLIGVFVPLAYILIKMIYNEIRSWTNG